jgi:hypothetical protein
LQNEKQIVKTFFLCGAFHPLQMFA